MLSRSLYDDSSIVESWYDRNIERARCQTRASSQEALIRVFLPNEPARNDLSITAVLYALSDEMRLDIVRELDRRGACACGEFEIDRPKSSLSHHFRVLRESGVVSTTRHGTALMNTLRRDDLDARFPKLLDAILGARPPAATRRTLSPRMRAARNKAGARASAS